MTKPPAAPPRKGERFTEQVTLQMLSVTEAKGKAPAITARLIAAGMSLNRRRYPADVLRTATPKYEGVKVMLDHADGWTVPESVRNVAAIITAATWDEASESIVGTIHPATELESGRLLLDLARTESAFRRDGLLRGESSFFGFSHRAYVTGEHREPNDGEPYYNVEEVLEVDSVDAVVFPAAGGVLTGLAESRRAELHDRLRSAGLHPVDESGDDPAPPVRRKVTIMSKTKSARQFDTGGILLKVEGVDRSDLEPALQAAAGIGYAEATAEATAERTTLQAAIAHAEGERDAANAELATYRAKEAEAAHLETVAALMVERGVPEMARPALLERVRKSGLQGEKAATIVDAYAEGLKARAAAVTDDKVDPDVDAKEQRSDDDASESVAVGAAFYESQFGAKPAN